MASLRTQNALLFVIALCLVLLVVHFYSGHLVAKAQAQSINPRIKAAPSIKPPVVAASETMEESPRDPKAAHLYGQYCWDSGGFEKCAWFPIAVDRSNTKSGVLLTRSAAQFGR